MLKTSIYLACALLALTLLNSCSRDSAEDTGLQADGATSVDVDEGVQADLVEMTSEILPERDLVPKAAVAVVEKGSRLPKRTDDFVWFTGQFTMPEGLPLDDEPKVVVQIDSPGRISGDEWGPVTLNVNGTFRVPVPKEAREGKFVVLSKYLTSQYPHYFYVKKGAVSFQNRELTLGTCVQVYLTGAGSVDPSKLEVLGSLSSGWSPDQLAGDWPTENNEQNGLIHRATWSPQGFFEVPGVVKGWCNQICVRGQGIATAMQPFDGLELTPGEIHRFEVELAPAKSLVIQLVGSRKLPVHNAALQLWKRKGDEQGSHFEQWLDGAANSGTCTWEGLSPGAYMVQATADGFTPNSIMIEITATSDSTVEHELFLHSGFGVKGQVVWVDGTGIPNAKVTVQTFESDEALFNVGGASEVGSVKVSESKTTQTDDAGSFEISGFQKGGAIEVQVQGMPPGVVVPDGMNKLKARRFLRKSQVSASFADLEMGGSELRLILGGSGQGIRGLVTNDLGEPLQDFRIAVYQAGDERPKSSQKQFRSNLRGPKKTVTKVNERFKNTNGKFDFPNIQKGDWGLWVTASGHSGKWIPSVRTGQDATNVHLMRKASIRGIVVGPGGEEAQERVSVILRRTGEEGTNSVYAALEGSSFRFSDVESGTITLRAGPSSRFGISEVREISLAPGQQLEDVVLALRSFQKVTGQVDPDWLHTSYEVGLRSTARFDDIECDFQGNFEIAKVVPGNYTFEVHGDGSVADMPPYMPGWSREFTVVEGGENHVKVGPFERGVRVNGSIVSGWKTNDQAWIRFLDLSKGSNEYDAPVSADGTFSIVVPAGESYRVLLGVFGKAGYGIEWIGLGDLVRASSVERLALAVPSAQFQVVCVNEQGTVIVQNKRWHAPTLRFMFADLKGDSGLRLGLGELQNGGIQAKLLPNALYTVAGFVVTKAEGVYIALPDQKFVAPGEGVTKTIEVVVRKREE